MLALNLLTGSARPVTIPAKMPKLRAFRRQASLGLLSPLCFDLYWLSALSSVVVQPNGLQPSELSPSTENLAGCFEFVSGLFQGGPCSLRVGVYALVFLLESRGLGSDALLLLKGFLLPS